MTNKSTKLNRSLITLVVYLVLGLLAILFMFKAPCWVYTFSQVPGRCVNYFTQKANQ